MLPCCFCNQAGIESTEDVWMCQDPRAKLSRDLVALLADEYAPALNLLQRVFPAGLMQYLHQLKPRPPSLQQTERSNIAVRPFAFQCGDPCQDILSVFSILQLFYI